MTDGRAHIQTLIDGLSVQFLMLNSLVGAAFLLHPPVVITLSNYITISLHLVLDDHFAAVYKDVSEESSMQSYSMRRPVTKTTGVEPASCYWKVAGSIPLVCISKYPWARYWTPNCSWCADWHLSWQWTAISEWRVSVSCFRQRCLLNVLNEICNYNLFVQLFMLIEMILDEARVRVGLRPQDILQEALLRRDAALWIHLTLLMS